MTGRASGFQGGASSPKQRALPAPNQRRSRLKQVFLKMHQLRNYETETRFWNNRSNTERHVEAGSTIEASNLKTLHDFMIKYLQMPLVQLT